MCLLVILVILHLNKSPQGNQKLYLNWDLLSEHSEQYSSIWDLIFPLLCEHVCFLYKLTECAYK